MINGLAASAAGKQATATATKRLTLKRRHALVRNPEYDMNKV